MKRNELHNLSPVNIIFANELLFPKTARSFPRKVSILRRIRAKSCEDSSPASRWRGKSCLSAYILMAWYICMFIMLLISNTLEGIAANEKNPELQRMWSSSNASKISPLKAHTISYCDFTPSTLYKMHLVWLHRLNTNNIVLLFSILGYSTCNYDHKGKATTL